MTVKKRGGEGRGQRQSGDETAISRIRQTNNTHFSDYIRLQMTTFYDAVSITWCICESIQVSRTGIALLYLKGYFNSLFTRQQLCTNEGQQHKLS